MQAATTHGEMSFSDSGEDGIRVERVIVTERNVAQQVVREVEIERTLEDGRERQTTVRVVGYDTLTSEAHELRAMAADEARGYVFEAEQRELLSVPAPDALAGMRGPDGELGTDVEPEAYLAARDAEAEGRDC